MPYLGLQRKLFPGVQVSSLINGSISLTGAPATATTSVTYFTSGLIFTDERTWLITKFNQVIETVSQAPNNEGFPRAGLWGFSNSGTAGYSGSGSTRQNGDNVGYAYRNKLIYATESFNTTAANIQAANTVYARGMENTNVAGYIMGGTISGSYANAAYKLPFSTDVTATLGAILSTERNGPGTFSNGSTSGYIAGGQRAGGGGAMNLDTNKMAYSNDAISTLASTWSSSSTVHMASMTYASTAGYTAGGEGAGYTSATKKIVFSTDTASVPSATLSTTKGGSTGGWSPVAGFICGGYNGTYFNAIEKLLFSTETMSVTSAISLLKATHGAGMTNNG
jgi:hypothetical protein